MAEVEGIDYGLVMRVRELEAERDRLREAVARLEQEKEARNLTILELQHELEAARGPGDEERRSGG